MYPAATTDFDTSNVKLLSSRVWVASRRSSKVCVCGGGDKCIVSLL